jgi:hypothetical protein
MFNHGGRGDHGENNFEKRSYLNWEFDFSF